MKVEAENLADHQKKLTVTLDSEALEGAKKRAARRLARNTKIPGFRPGKAPYPVVARTIGEGAIIEEALEILVDEVYPEALEQAGVDPYGPGSLENVESMDPPVFEFRVPLAPSVELGDYNEIRIPYEPTEPAESEVHKVLNDLRENQAVIEHVDRPAEAGDIVYLTLSGNVISEGPEDDQDPVVADRKLNLLIRTEEEGSQPDEWPFPGFNQDMIMAAAGDVREIEYDFPDEESAGIFRGKSVLFNAAVDEVVSHELPPLDDEFARSVGEFETVADLREYVASSLRENSSREYDEAYTAKVLDKLVGISSIEYPPQMVEHELEHMLERFERQIANLGMDLDVYLKTRDMSRQDLEEEMRPEAESRIRRSLALLQFISQEAFEIDKDEVQVELERTMEIITSTNDRPLSKANVTAARTEMESRLINRHIERAAFDRLKAIASGELSSSLSDEGSTASESGLGEADEADAPPKKVTKKSKKAATGKSPAKKAKKPAKVASDTSEESKP